MENSRKYYWLNIIVNITSFNPLNTTVSLKQESKINRRDHEFFTKKLMGYEILFSSMIPWATKYFFRNL